MAKADRTDDTELPRVKVAIGDRPLACLRYIVEYAMLKKQYPTHSEIAAHMGVSRTQSGRYIDLLEKKKLVDRIKGEHARNIRATPLGMECLSEEYPDPMSQKQLFGAQPAEGTSEAGRK